MSEEGPLDFLGTPIKVGDRAIRAHSYAHWKEFKKVEIKDIEEVKSGKHPAIFQPFKIKVLTDGAVKEGWTFPERLIVHRNFKVPI